MGRLNLISNPLGVAGGFVPMFSEKDFLCVV